MVYLFLADGFEECEALVPLDILRRGGIEVKTVGIGNQFITGTHSITVKADITDDTINLDGDFHGIILPGGMPGTNNLQKNQIVDKALRVAKENNKLICAICAAPKILGNMGMLRNKNATCFPGFEEDLIGAKLSNNFVVKDENIITAKGAGVAYEFGFKILEALTNAETATQLKRQMQCP